MGYLAREGWSNLNVRLLLIRKKIANPSEVLDACERNGVTLEPDYPTVLRKLAISLDYDPDEGMSDTTRAEAR